MLTGSRFSFSLPFSPYLSLSSLPRSSHSTFSVFYVPFRDGNPDHLPIFSSSHSILFSSTCYNVGIIILFFSLPPKIFCPLLFLGRSPCLPSSPLPFRFLLSRPSPQTLIQNEESCDFEMKSRVLLCLKLCHSALSPSLWKHLGLYSLRI